MRPQTVKSNCAGQGGLRAKGANNRTFPIQKILIIQCGAQQLGTPKKQLQSFLEVVITAYDASSCRFFKSESTKPVIIQTANILSLNIIINLVKLISYLFLRY